MSSSALISHLGFVGLRPATQPAARIIHNGSGGVAEPTRPELQQGPPTPAVANVDIDSEGFGWIPEDDFLGHFAADIDPVKAKVMYAVQQPLHTSTFDDVMGTPAWKSLPSWYLGADTIEVASGHCAMVSHQETHERIVTAANAVA